MSNSTIIARMSKKNIAEIATEISRLRKKHYELDGQISPHKEREMSELWDLMETLRMVISYMEPQTDECLAALIAVGHNYYEMVATCGDGYQNDVDLRAARRCFASALKHMKCDELPFAEICLKAA